MILIFHDISAVRPRWYNHFMRILDEHVVTKLLIIPINKKMFKKL